MLSIAATPHDALEKSIAELQADMAAGRTTAAQLVRFYLQRIAAFDQAGPRLNAVLFVNPHAVAQAQALDAERSKKGSRSPLHGIPVLLKDNFDTNDMPTTGGCLALSGIVPRNDAFQVRRLREAGAIVLGKVNLHELALGLTTISSLGGQTIDPYDLKRAPGGSSGGSAVAVAANFAAFALGTDTSGSIRIPSSHNAIVGLRPTAGLSSRSGIIPFGHTQDTGGPMARTVADVAAVLDATVGYDPADPITATSDGHIPRTYLSSLDADAVKRATLGVLAEFFGAAPEDQEVGGVVRAALGEMRAQGATVVDVAVPGLAGQLMASNLLSQELKFYLGDYLKRSGAGVMSVEELLASGLHTAQIGGFLELANGQPDDYLKSEDYRRRLAAREALAAAVVSVMDNARVDAIVYPTARRIAPIVGGNQLGSNAALSAQTGLPAITVPAGFTASGFPVGIEMIGRPFSEPTLIALAYGYERGTAHRRPPATTPAAARGRVTKAAITGAPRPDAGIVRFEVVATGAQTVPPSDIGLRLRARFTFNEHTRELGYALALSGPARDQIAGVFLHRRANRPNGGVAYILAKPPARSPTSSMTGTVTLLDAEVADLKAGRCYVSAVKKSDPRVGVSATLQVPITRS